MDATLNANIRPTTFYVSGADSLFLMETAAQSSEKR
jgi:hypothetical protein